jgi:hypothetical protein
MFPHFRGCVALFDLYRNKKLKNLAELSSLDHPLIESKLIKNIHQLSFWILFVEKNPNPMNMFGD